LRVGKVLRVIGPVVDVEFFTEELPPIYNAIRITEGEINLVVEVSQYLGENVVRCIATSSTDGLVRGMDAVDTDGPISMPVGPETLGRLFNLLGDPIDELGPVNEKKRYPIHRPPPSFEEQVPASTVFEASRSSISSNLTLRGGRWAYLGGPASARPFSSWS
jgi:F-type H+-transporting ATPase subunit beta